MYQGCVGRPLTGEVEESVGLGMAPVLAGAFGN